MSFMIHYNRVTAQAAEESLKLLDECLSKAVDSKPGQTDLVDVVNKMRADWKDMLSRVRERGEQDEIKPVKLGPAELKLQHASDRLREEYPAPPDDCCFYCFGPISPNIWIACSLIQTGFSQKRQVKLCAQCADNMLIV